MAPPVLQSWWNIVPTVDSSIFLIKNFPRQNLPVPPRAATLRRVFGFPNAAVVAYIMPRYIPCGDVAQGDVNSYT